MVRGEREGEKYTQAYWTGIFIKLAVDTEMMDESVNVRPENSTQLMVVDLCQLFTESVPYVEGNLSHLRGGAGGVAFTAATLVMDTLVGGSPRSHGYQHTPIPCLEWPSPRGQSSAD